MTNPTDIRDLRWPDPMPLEEEMLAALDDYPEVVEMVIQMLVRIVEVKHLGPLQEFIDFWWGGSA